MGVNKQLSLNDLLNIDDTREKEFYVKEWGGTVIIKTLTAGARDEYEKSCLIKNENGDWIKNPVMSPAKFVAACLYQPDGQKMFRTPEHVEQLERKSFSVVNRIFDECLSLNAMDFDAVEDEIKK